MFRIALLGAIALLTAGRTLQAQDREAGVPPIPRQERFTARSDLTATLRLSTDRVRFDELPKATLVLKNVGAKRLLLRKPWVDAVSPNPVARVYTASGEQLQGDVSMCRCAATLVSLRDVTFPLEPQQEYEIELTVPQVGIPPRSIGEVAAFGVRGGRPPGDYVVRATYSNAPDFWYGTYNVYDPDADQVWEGVIETPPARFTVLALDENAVQEIVAALDGDGNADAAIARAWHSRDPRTADALVRRFQRDRSSGPRVLAALRAIDDMDAVAGLLEEARSTLRAPDDPAFSDAAFDALLTRRWSAIRVIETLGDPRAFDY